MVLPQRIIAWGPRKGPVNVGSERFGGICSCGGVRVRGGMSSGAGSSQ